MPFIDSGSGRMIHISEPSELPPVDAEMAELRIFYHEAGRSMHGLYVWDSPWHAVAELGPGFYCIAAWNAYQIRKLIEIRPTGQEMPA